MLPNVTEVRRLWDVADDAAARLLAEPEACAMEPDALLITWGLYILALFGRSAPLTESPHRGDRSVTLTAEVDGAPLTAPVGEVVSALGLVAGSGYRPPDWMPPQIAGELRALTEETHA